MTRTIASAALLAALAFFPSGALQAQDDPDLKKALEDALKKRPDLKKLLEKALKGKGKQAKRAAGGKQAKRSAEKTIRRYRAYLSRKPYHDWAFDKLVAAAVSQNGLSNLVKWYEKRIKDEPHDSGARIVLARLYARTKQLERGLELLKKLPAELLEKPAMGKLLGELYLRGNQPKKALELLERAAKQTKDKKLLRGIHRRRGEAALAAGQRGAAVSAFRAMAELNPNSFNTRLEVAEVFAVHGLHEEALKELATAERLAGGDAKKRCQVLSETGKLHERRVEIKKALAVYRKALDLLARGHWLKRDLQARILSIHRRSGQLDALIAACQADVDKSPKDLGRREFLARALAAAGKRKRAREVLSGAVKDFPKDLKISRQLIAVLTDLKDPDAVIQEYQRILTQHPKELDLYLELGKVFASAGRFKQAKLQWERTLAKRLQDASLAIKLAELYALYDRTDEAAAMYRKAIALEPKEIPHYADLTRLLARAKRPQQVQALLDQASKVAQGNASLLQQVSQLWEEHKKHAGALRLVEAAVKLKQEATLLRRVAKLQVRLGKLDLAAKTLRTVINTAKDFSMRRAAIDTILRLATKQNQLPQLVAREEAAVKAGAKDLAPYLILAKAHSRKRRPGPAITVLEALLELQPAQEDAHRMLARLCEQQGDYARALIHYRVLVKKTPQARRKYLKAIAEIHLTRYEQKKAFACYQEILRGSPNNAAAFVDVAKAYEKLNFLTKAKECLRQAVRLKPEDGKTRLKLARLLRRLGENDQARDEIVAAVRSEDEEVREDARKQLYEFLGEQGALEKEIETLRGRIDTNPYDVEAPLTLTDIYIRELEYELALELLEKLLGYQPRQPKLLEQRARLNFLMERYPEAIADYETLWKLPKSDRQRLALKIAEAAIKHGDLERAARAVASVKDAKKVASLYEEHDLLERAQAALERGVARDPTNVKLHKRLAKLHTDAGDRKQALASLERVLALVGDRWKIVKQLGDLHHKLGNKQQALALGKRLFALIRQKEEEKDKDKQSSNSYYPSYYYSYYASRGGSAHYRQRVNELRTYFQNKGLKKEFGAIGIRELKLQPTNEALLEVLVRHLRGKEAKQAADAIEWVQKVAKERKKTPPGYTPLSWQDYLDGLLLRTYQQNMKLALQIGMQVYMKAMAGKATEREFVGLTMLLGQQRRVKEAKGLAIKGLETFPTSVRLLLGLADLYHSHQKRYADAVPYYEKAVKLLAEPKRKAADEAEAAKRADLAFKKQKRYMLQQFPATVQSRVTDAHLRRLYDLSDTRSYGSWILGSRPSLDAARRKLATCLLKLKKTEAAKKILTALTPKSAKERGALGRWSSLASLYYQEELFAEAEAICLRLQQLERALSTDPILGLSRSWEYSFRSPMGTLGRIWEKRGKVLEAYDLLRSYGDAKAGELLLTKTGKLEQASAHYRGKVEAAYASKAQGTEPRRHLRDVAIKRAEILMIQKKWPQVLSSYERLIQRLPDDFSLYKVVAALHERADRFEKAVATHKRIIARKRVLKRRPERNIKPKGRRIQPTMPVLPDTDQSWVWQNLSYSWGWRAPGQRNLSVKENYTAILKIYLNRKKTSKAAEVLRQLAREDASTFRWMGWTLSELIKNYRLGAKGVPILRLLHGYNKKDEWLALEYGKALVAAKKFEDAHKLFTKLVNKSRRSEWVQREAQQQLDQLEVRLNRGKRVTYAGLKKAAEADPKNVKKRTKLARWLFKERRYEDALAEVRVAQKFAPHLKRVRGLLVDCLTVLGRIEELKQALKRDLKSSKAKEEKFVIWIRLANLAYEPKKGVTPEVEKCLKEALRVFSHRPEYSAANWYVEKGLFKQARTLLKKEIKKLDKNRWIANYARTRLRQLNFLAGKPAGGLDTEWEKLEKASSQGAKTTAFQAMANTLRSLPNPAKYKVALLQEADKHKGVRRSLYRAAYFLATRDLKATEAELAAAVKADPKKTLYLYPLLIGLARARHAPRAALKWIEQLEATNPGSENSVVGTSIGYISERNALRGEKGSLLFQLGEKQKAFAEWAKIHDPSKKESLLQLAYLYSEHDLRDKAIETIRTYLKKVGERSPQPLSELADLLKKQKKYAEALEVLERARILTRKQQRQGIDQKIHDLYRLSGKLPAYRAKLAAKWAKDKNDIGTAIILAKVLMELEDEAALTELLVIVAKKPNMARGAYQTLADLHETGGNFKQAATFLEKVLEGNVQSWNRRQFCERLARMRIKSGQKTKALPALKKGYEDPDSLEALTGIAGFLQREGLYQEALRPLKQAIRLDPKAVRARTQMIGVLLELKRPKEALKHLWVCFRSPKAMEHISGWGYTTRRVFDELGAAQEKALVEGPLAKKPTNPELLFRAAAVDLFRKRYARAEKRVARLLQQKPTHLAARWVLWRSRMGQRIVVESIEALEGLIKGLELEAAVNSQLQWRMRSFVDELGRLHLRKGDLAGAKAAWKRKPGDRFKKVRSYRYTYYNSPNMNLGQAARLLGRHHLYKEQVAGLERARLLGRGWEGRGLGEAYFRAGQQERALDLAWRLVEDPVTWVLGKANRNTYYPRSAYGMQGYGDSTGLLKYHRELERVPALEKRVRTLLKREPKNRKAKGLLKAILRSQKKWTELLAIEQKELAENPQDQVTMSALVTTLMRLKRFEEAIPLQAKVIKQQRANRIQLKGGRSYFPSFNRNRRVGKRIRFAWGGSSGSSSSSYVSYGSSSWFNANAFGQARQVLMVLYAKSGNSAEAKRLEQRELRDARKQEEALLRLARAYAGAELVAPAERLCAAAQSAYEAKEQDPKKRARFADRWRGLLIGLHWTLRKDAKSLARFQVLSKERLARYAERIAKAKDAVEARSARNGRAEFLIRHGLDIDQAVKDARACVGGVPHSLSYQQTLAWALLKAGQKDEALLHFQSAQEKHRLEGVPYRARFLFGLGLALHGTGKVKQARPWLLRALASYPEHAAADEARAALGKLKAKPSQPKAPAKPKEPEEAPRDF